MKKPDLAEKSKDVAEVMREVWLERHVERLFPQVAGLITV